MASRDVLKVSALHYKDASKTDEEFEKHINENINPAWMQLVKRHEVMKYSVVSYFFLAVFGAIVADVEMTSGPLDLLPLRGF